VKQKTNTPALAKVFVISIILAGLFFVIDVFVSNRASNYVQSISSSVIFGILGLVPFTYGAVKSWEQKNYNLLILNVLAIIIIVGWTLWISLIVYGFKDFQLTLPQ
jgi:cation transport ATPase